MPLPRRVARFNRVVTNRLFAPLAGRVPPWIVVEHIGRRSGRRYRTVVWGFPRGSELAIALTYGPGSDWVRNVLAAGGCRVRFGGRWRTFNNVKTVEGQAGLRLLPAILRRPLFMAGLRTVLSLRPA